AMRGPSKEDRVRGRRVAEIETGPALFGRGIERDARADGPGQVRPYRPHHGRRSVVRNARPTRALAIPHGPHRTNCAHAVEGRLRFGLDGDARRAMSSWARSSCFDL